MPLISQMLMLLSHHRAVGAATLFHRTCSARRYQICYASWWQTFMSITLGWTVCEIQWSSSESPKIKPCQPCMHEHFYHLGPNYWILFLHKFQPLDQGASRQSFSREVNHFWGATSSAASTRLFETIIYWYFGKISYFTLQEVEIHAVQIIKYDKLSSFRPILKLKVTFV